MTSVVSQAKQDTVSKTFTVPPQGDLRRNTTLELRAMRHSNRFPTALYILKDESFTVSIAGGNLSVDIGQYGTYSYLNDQKNIGFTRFELSEGEHTITFDKGDAMIYLINHSENDAVEATVSGAYPAPVFYIDQTTQDEWVAQLDNYTQAPLVEIVGNYVFASYQYPIANGLSRNLDMNGFINNMDMIFLMQIKLAGLDFNMIGDARKHRNRLHIATPFSGAGSAYASNEHIGFQENTGSAQRLLELHAIAGKNAEWAICHEMGHTFQNPSYTTSYFSEVTVNIPAYIIKLKLGKGEYYSDNTRKRDEIKKFVERDDLKDFTRPTSNNDTNLWIQLGMFIQLYWAYGDDFFPRLNQRYRAYRPAVTNDNEEIQTFMLYASMVAERNLTQFFNKWGLYPEDTIQREMIKYPEPAVPIWENIYNGFTVDQHVAPYSPPQATIKKNTIEYVIGSKLPEDLILNYLEVIPGINPPVKTNWLQDDNMSDDTTVGILIEDTMKNINRLSLDVTFCYGNAISFQTYVDKERLILSLLPDKKSLHVFHDKYDKTPLTSGNGLFATLIMYDKDGQEIKSFSFNKEEDGRAFAEQVSGTPFEDGQILELRVYTTRRFTVYSDSSVTLARNEAKSHEYLLISKSKFIKLLPADLAPKATPVPVSTDVGLPINAEAFVRDVSVRFGTEAKIEFASKPVFERAGNTTVKINVTDEIGNTARFEAPLSIRYNRAIALRSYYNTQERIVLRFDVRARVIAAFADPQWQGALDSGRGLCFEFILYSADKTLKKRVIVDKEEKPFGFVAEINGTLFEDDDLIQIISSNKGRISAYNLNNPILPYDQSLTSEWFRITDTTLYYIQEP